MKQHYVLPDIEHMFRRYVYKRSMIIVSHVTVGTSAVSVIQYSRTSVNVRKALFR